VAAGFRASATGAAGGTGIAFAAGTFAAVDLPPAAGLCASAGAAGLALPLSLPGVAAPAVDLPARAGFAAGAGFAATAGSGGRTGFAAAAALLGAAFATVGVFAAGAVFTAGVAFAADAAFRAASAAGAGFAAGLAAGFARDAFFGAAGFAAAFLVRLAAGLLRGLASFWAGRLFLVADAFLPGATLLAAAILFAADVVLPGFFGLDCGRLLAAALSRNVISNLRMGHAARKKSGTHHAPGQEETAFGAGSPASNHHRWEFQLPTCTPRPFAPMIPSPSQPLDISSVPTPSAGPSQYCCSAARTIGPASIARPIACHPAVCLRLVDA
jgi:hypothetical protein